MFEILGYLSVIVAAATGFIGAITNTKNENGKPNRAGKTVILIIILSLIVGITSKKIETDIKSKAQDKIDSINLAQSEIVKSLVNKLDTIVNGLDSGSTKLDNIITKSNKTGQTLESTSVSLGHLNKSAEYTISSLQHTEKTLNETRGQQLNLIEFQRAANINLFRTSSPLYPIAFKFHFSYPIDEKIRPYTDRINSEKLTKIIKDTSILIPNRNNDKEYFSYMTLYRPNLKIVFNKKMKKITSYEKGNLDFFSNEQEYLEALEGINQQNYPIEMTTDLITHSNQSFISSIVILKNPLKGNDDRVLTSLIDLIGCQIIVYLPSFINENTTLDYVTLRSTDLDYSSNSIIFNKSNRYSYKGRFGEINIVYSKILTAEELGLVDLQGLLNEIKGENVFDK